MITSNKDLWASALEDLPKVDRQQLAFYDGQDRLDILSDLQVLTQTAKEQCIKRRWRFSKPGHNGETIVLRDIFNKMIVWIDMFKQIGDTVVQYDPGHTALPWAGVRFILQIAVGDIVKFDFVVEGAESIARMIARYAIFEDIYLRRTSKASKELEVALVRLYSTILTYQSKAKSYFEQSSPRRILRSAFVTKVEFESLARKMDLEQSNVDRFAAIVDSENQNHINDSLKALSIGQHQEQAGLLELLRTIDGPVLRMSDQLNDVEDHLDKHKRYEILRWVSAQPYMEHHEQVSKNALPGTGKWLLEDPTYADWLKASTSSLLWLHGKVGAGKSTLVSIVIEDAKRRFEAGQSPPPVYFYCSRNAAEPERSDPAAILSSIVRQLSCAEPGLPLLPPVVQKYEKKGQGFNSWGLQIEESCELITQLIEHYPMTTIVIDALDECDPEKRDMLLDAIENLLQNSSLGLMKVFLSSRDDQDLVCTLRVYPNLDLTSRRNSADIEAFVREETDRLVRKRRLLRNSKAKEELKDLIIVEVSRSADGMFRWASLQLELLCTMKLDQDVRARLGRLPPKLEQLYQEIYEENLLKYPGESGQSAIRNITKWLLCAQRQMKSSEFCTAVAMTTVPTEELTKDHVLDLCHNFVVFDDGLDAFRFAHLSVREFLEKRPEYTANSCHLLAAETCLLQFISLSKWSAAEDFLQHHYALDLRGKFASSAQLLGGFNNYATIFWARHCQLIGEEGRKSNPRFERVFRFFLSDASPDLSPLSIWIQSDQRRVRDDSLQMYLHPSFGPQPEDRVYYVACAYGFCEILRTFMNGNPPKDRKKGWLLAAENNEGEALKLILRDRSEDEISIDLVRVVALDMDPEILDWVLSESKTEVTTLLSELVNFWHYSKMRKVIVERLIAKCKPSEVSQTILEYAARFCSRKTFESLLPQSDRAGTSWDLLLEQAGREGNLEVMILLLDKKDLHINPNIMRAIAMSGDEKAMQLLLNREDSGEVTKEVINAGVLNQNEKVLGLLLDRGGSGAISTKAINRAIENCNERILGLLLDSGYQMSQTLVNKAAANGSASTLRLLLDRGGVITGPVLRCAAGNDVDGAKIMSLLLAEAQEWMVTEEMAEMMKIAAQSRSEGSGTMKRLLERAGDMRITEDVLLTAARNSDSRDELIKGLCGRDWEMTEEVLEAMMSHLSSEETLQLLLDRLDDLEVTGRILLAAASNPYFGDQLVGLLLDRVNFLNILNPLLVQAAGNYKFGLEVMLLLQRRVGNINAPLEAMERAVREGSMRTTTFLLDHTSTPITETLVVGALVSKDPQKVQLVLDRAVDLPVTRNMVHMAARHSDLKCLALIWERACRAEMTEDVTRDLAQAAILNRGWSVGVLRFLLNEVEGVVVGPEALMSITRKGFDEVPLLNLLIDRGMNLQVTQGVLQAAAGNHRDDSAMMTILLERSDKAMLGDELFRAAAGSGAVGILKVLSKYRGLAEVPNKWLDLARLHDAVDSYPSGSIDRKVRPTRDIDLELDLVKELLAQGVEPDAPDGRGQTPLMHAAILGNILTAKALLSAGADANSQDRQGRTPLFFAASGGHYGIVEILLALPTGPNADSKDRRGQTPLCFAAAGGHYGIVEMLLDLGVQTHVEDEDGNTPGSMAKSEGHMRVFRLLERRRQP